MKKEILTKMVWIIISIMLIPCAFAMYKTVQEKNYSIGQITAKYRNGDRDKTYHIVVQDETRDNKLMDITVDSGEYDKYEITQRVYISYNWVRQAKTIRLKTLEGECEYK